MKLKRLTITHFKAFGEDQRIDFTEYNEDDVIMIMGRNHDDPGMDSNGAAKTSILDAICWCLLGVIPDQADVSEVIKFGEKSCEVILTLVDAQGNDHMVCRRRRIKKRSTKEEVSYQLNGEDKSERTNSQTQEMLMKLWGFESSGKTYLQDFTNTTYFPVDLAQGITSKQTTSSDKFNLIARYLRLQKVDEVKEKLKKKDRIFSDSIKSLLTKQESIEEFLSSISIENTEELIKDYRYRAIKGEAEIKRLTSKVSKLKSTNNLFEKLDELEIKKSTLALSLTNYGKELKEKGDSLAKSNAKLKAKEEELDNLEKTLHDTVDQEDIKKRKAHLKGGYQKQNKLQNFEKDIAAQLEEHLSCPNCKADLMLSDTEKGKALVVLDIEKLKAMYKDIEANVESISEKIKSLEEKIESLELSNQEAKEHQSAISNAKDVIVLTKSGIKDRQDTVDKYTKLRDESKRNLEEVKAEIVDIESKLKGEDQRDQIELLETNIVEARELINSFLISIGNLEKTISDHENKVKELKVIKSDLEEKVKENAPIEFWLSNIDEMKRWIIESFLPELEQLTNKYLADIETGFTIKFNTVKEKKNNKGELKQEFNITIVDSSQQERNITSFSKGESYRIAICTGFALRQLTLNQGSNNFDFILVDEIVDGIDKTGVMEFTHLLEKIQGLKLIISHNPDIGDSFSNHITAIKENGTSTIKQS